MHINKQDDQYRIDDAPNDCPVFPERKRQSNAQEQHEQGNQADFGGQNVVADMCECNKWPKQN